VSPWYIKYGHHLALKCNSELLVFQICNIYCCRSTNHCITVSAHTDGTVFLLNVPSKLFLTHFPPIKTAEAGFFLYCCNYWLIILVPNLKTFNTTAHSCNVCVIHFTSTHFLNIKFYISPYTSGSLNWSISTTFVTHTIPILCFRAS